jgi:hypothetical protein
VSVLVVGIDVDGARIRLWRTSPRPARPSVRSLRGHGGGGSTASAAVLI